MGLLDSFDTSALNDPSMGMAMGLLSAGGPSRMPISLGQGLAAGYQGYQQAQMLMQKQKQEQMQSQMLQMQIEQAKQALASKKALSDALGGIGDTPASGPTPPGLSPASAAAFGLPASVATQDTRPGMSAGQVLAAAAIKARDYAAYQEAQKMLLEEKKLAPKWANEPRTVRGPGGNTMLVQMADDGSVRPIQGGYAPAEKLSFHNTGQNTVGLDPYTGQTRASLANTMSPDAKASNALGWSRLNQEFGDNAQFTPGAVDNAAARYNIDGTLPPMGMGMMGGQARAKILNRAAELAQQSGVSPDDLRIAQLGNKANTAALSKLQQQQTMVGAFERNFVKNADIALEYSQKVDRTGVPLANKWLNAGKRSIGGDPDLAAFDQAIKSASNEYAKIISGSMGNTAVAEGEIKKIESLLNAAQTPEQVSAVLGLMKRETANRMAGFTEEKQALVQGIRDPTARKAPSAAAQEFDMLPAASGFAGKRMRAENGTVYKSDGTRWIKE